jgi:hypothetical protein
LPAVSIGVGLGSSDFIRELLNFGGTPVLDLISKDCPPVPSGCQHGAELKPLILCGFKQHSSYRK